MDEEPVLMIVLRSQVVIKFGAMAGSSLVLGRPVSSSVILEIVTTKVLCFFCYHVWAPILKKMSGVVVMLNG